MIIRKWQMLAFEEDARRRFVRRAIAALRARFPKRLENTSDDTLMATVNTGWERAGTYGIEDESWVLEFLGYLVQFGDDFPETPETAWGREVLQRTELTQEERIVELDCRCLRHMM